MKQFKLVSTAGAWYTYKKADGTGGGSVYILSSTSDDVYSYNVEIKYNEWTTTPLVQISNMDLAFKSFKWSNDHINGNISPVRESPFFKLKEGKISCIFLFFIKVPGRSSQVTSSPI